MVRAAKLVKKITSKCWWWIISRTDGNISGDCEKSIEDIPSLQNADISRAVWW